MKPTFDPNAAAGVDSGIFGLPYSEADSSLVYLPVPWEATTSYGGGTSKGPEAIRIASRQVDLYDHDVLRPYEAGLHALLESEEVHSWNRAAKALAGPIIAAGGDLGGDPDLERELVRVNSLGEKLNDWVKRETRRILHLGKIPAIVGGDHSVPFGAFQAVAEREAAFGVLHFDAHSDTRDAYEGFQWSHASIFRNALERIPQITKLVQVGIRDYCEEEMIFCAGQGSRVQIYFDADLSARGFAGEAWASVCREIVSHLPSRVWISFDIDGLDPKLCPHTGTPVPGGLEFQQAVYLVGEVVRQKKTILGFDLNEVAPDPGGSEWDANVGARLLYKLTAWTLASQGKASVSGTIDNVRRH